MFKINIKLSIILIFFIPVYIISYMLFKKPLYETSFKFKEKQNEFFSVMNEQLHNIKIVKINSWFNLLGNELIISFDSLFKTAISYSKISYFFSNIDLSINRLSNIILLTYGGFQVINGSLTIGDFSIVSSYFNILLSCTSYFLNLGKNYQNALASYARLKEILETPIELNGSKKITEIETIELKNVSFCYDNKLVIENFSYRFKKGNIYCIVGKNGSGKSTLVNLLLGLFNDYKGSIYYNHINIKDLDLYNVRENLIGVTEQEPTLINDTIKNNITYGLTSVSDHLIDKWNTKFNIHEFINNLPNGLNSNIFENSSNISGGEKQKLSLIRTFIKDPQMIVFDEPNSALDKNGVLILESTLEEIKQNKIIILVTHNSDIISIADKVISF